MDVPVSENRPVSLHVFNSLTQTSWPRAIEALQADSFDVNTETQLTGHRGQTGFNVMELI